MKSRKHYLALSVRAPLAVRGILEALVFDCGCSGVEERTDGFLAAFPHGVSRQALQEVIQAGTERVRSSGIGAPYHMAIEEIPDTDWSVQWKDRFQPVEVGHKLLIRAPWHSISTERITIIIEPSMAFGTGEHPTTRLCLEVIEQCAEYPHGEGLLDIGTGTGILAIAAAKLGFRHVTAIDTDPVAVGIARENSRINSVTDITVSSAPLSEVQGTFDVIAGNLTSETIKTVFPDCIDRTGRRGTCVFSGILHEQADEMLSFFRGYGVQTLTLRESEGWCAMVLQL